MNWRIESKSIIGAAYLLFFAGIACSFRAAASIGVILLLLAGILTARKATLSPLGNPRVLFVSASLLFSLFQAFTLIYSHHFADDAQLIQTKLALAITPAAVLLTTIHQPERWKYTQLTFITVVTLVSLFCLINASTRYAEIHDSRVFFYHELVGPVIGHAVYFSVMVFAALVMLIENPVMFRAKTRRALSIATIVLLAATLLLLASKLVIAFFIAYLAVFLCAFAKQKGRATAIAGLALSVLILGSAILLSTNNPVSSRFRDLFSGSLSIMEERKFNPGMYFNGAQFRLLQWRFTGEILTEQNAWISGTGQTGAQHLLNEKYMAANMYVGEPARQDRGFIGYNTHNQFLDTTLEAGLPGLLLLVLLCTSLVRLVWVEKKRDYAFIIGLLIAWLFTESVLERQFGMMIFSSVPLLLSTRKNSS